VELLGGGYLGGVLGLGGGKKLFPVVTVKDWARKEALEMEGDGGLRGCCG